MTLNEKFINYKVLGLAELYNFDIKFVFIQNYMKHLSSWDRFYGGSYHHPSVEIIFGKVVNIPEESHSMIQSCKCFFRRRSESYSNHVLFVGAWDLLERPWKIIGTCLQIFVVVPTQWKLDQNEDDGGRKGASRRMEGAWPLRMSICSFAHVCIYYVKLVYRLLFLGII